MTWHFIEAGHGRPLVLLHGIGGSAGMWKTVMPLLARERRVIAFDVAGFGRTPRLPAWTPPTAANLATALGDTLHRIGITTPVDIAGNSMGGYIALEAAKQGLARSVVGLSPAGLWGEHGLGRHVSATLQLARWSAVNMPAVAQRAMDFAPLRALTLAIPVSIGSWKMPVADARECTADLSAATGFEETFANAGRFSGGRTITAPLTIAFGTRDWLLTKSAQQRDELPSHTRWLKPRGWGHVPMWDDPEGVARLILEGTQ
jgi:pimeloyl-ACP methyl ester carboxylesterase